MSRKYTLPNELRDEPRRTLSVLIPDSTFQKMREILVSEPQSTVALITRLIVEKHSSLNLP